MTINLDRLVSEAQGWVPRSSRLHAIGLATVDLERATDSFGLDVWPASPSAALGARCATATTAGGTVVVLLEPATEGRLAGWLARHGEGLVAVWSSVDGDPGLPVGPPTDGPFGAERPLLDGAPDGPYVFLLERPPVTING